MARRIRLLGSLLGTSLMGVLTVAVAVPVDAGSDSITVTVDGAGGEYTATLQTDPLDRVEVGESVTISGDVEPGAPLPPGSTTTFAVAPTLEITSATIGASYGTCTIGTRSVDCEVVPVSPFPTPDASFEITALAASPGLDQPVTWTIGGPPAFPVTIELDTTIDVIESATPGSVSVRFDDPGEPRVGVTSRIGIIVENPGSTPMDDVRLDVELPDGIGYRALTPVGPCPRGAVPPTCSIGTLAPFSAARSEVVLVPTEPVADVELTATVSTSTAEPQPDPTPNTDTIAFEILPSDADLEIEVEQPAPPVLTGLHDIDVSVRNNGPSLAEDVEFRVDVPAGHVFDSARSLSTNRPRPDCSVVDDDIVCQLGDIGQRFSNLWHRYRVTTIPVTAAASSPTAVVTSAAGDGTPSNNEVTFDVVEAVPGDAEVRATVFGRSEFVGATTESQTIVWRNNGPAAAADVTIDLTVPSGWTISEADPSPPECDVAVDRITCSVPTIGERDEFRLPFDLTSSLDAESGPMVADVAYANEPRFSRADLDRPLLVGDYVSVTMTRAECRTLGWTGALFGYGSSNGALRAFVVPVAGIVEPGATVTPTDPSDDCERRILFTYDQLDGLDTIADATGTDRSEAAGGVAEFVLAIWNLFFEPV